MTAKRTDFSFKAGAAPARDGLNNQTHPYNIESDVVSAVSSLEPLWNNVTNEINN